MRRVESRASPHRSLYTTLQAYQPHASLARARSSWRRGEASDADTAARHLELDRKLKLEFIEPADGTELAFGREMRVRMAFQPAPEDGDAFSRRHHCSQMCVQAYAAHGKGEVTCRNVNSFEEVHLGPAAFPRAIAGER